MSKSLGNVIQLKDPPEIVKRQVMSMFTDETKLYKGDPGHPYKCPVYIYHQAFSQTKLSCCDLKERAERCMSGKLGCVECKKDLARTLNNFLDPIRTRRSQAEKDSLGTYLQEGTKKAHQLAQVTMKAVRKAMHLDYPSVFKS